MNKLKVEMDAYADGSMAYNDGKTAHDNPHAPESVQGAAWLNGWSDAFDFDNSVPSEFEL